MQMTSNDIIRLNNLRYRFSDAWEAEPGCMQIQTNHESFVEIHADLH